MPSTLIGVDLGTSTCKVISVDDGGTVTRRIARDYPTISRRLGWAEQEPGLWWQAADEAIAELTAGLPEGGREVAGIGLCGQMHGLAALDQNNEVLRPAILWNDQRAAPHCEWIIERAGGLDGLLELTRNRMLPGFTGGKIIWLRENEPGVYAATRHFLNPKDYLRLRMTGEFVTDVSDASGTGLFDVRNRRWSTELLGRLDIPPELLPHTVESIEPTGAVRADLARRWNIPPGTRVYGGGGDAVIQTTAMGLVDPGPVGVTLGTAGIVAGGNDSCPDNPGGRIQVSCGNAPGRWHVMGVSLSAGGALTWLREVLQPLLGNEKLTFARLIALAGQAPAGCGGLLFLPYLHGERSPHVAPEASAAWIGLTPMHSVEHLARSVIEGVLLNMRETLDVCVQAGLTCSRVVASGGATSEPFWLSLLADVLGREVVTVTGATEGGAYGAALAAGVGAGHWASLEEALTRVRPERSFPPNSANIATYDAVFDGHRRLYAHLRDAFADTARAGLA
jgi:xylulokinase